jgi:tRNA threonylcarbamoyladenosine biosynthesis protein TsaE
MPSSPSAFRLEDEAATLAMGAALARVLTPGLTIYLIGDLGAGKTTLVRGLLRALGHAGPVKSPTYTLVELYVISGYIMYHFDFYRFNRPEEWLEAGLDEPFNQDSIRLVEWPGKAGKLLPPADLEATIELAAHADGNLHGNQHLDARRITFQANSERGKLCLSGLRFLPPGRAP